MWCFVSHVRSVYSRVFGTLKSVLPRTASDKLCGVIEHWISFALQAPATLTSTVTSSIVCHHRPHGVVQATIPLLSSKSDILLPTLYFVCLFTIEYSRKWAITRNSTPLFVWLSRVRMRSYSELNIIQFCVSLLYAGDARSRNLYLVGLQVVLYQKLARVLVIDTSSLQKYNSSIPV